MNEMGKGKRIMMLCRRTQGGPSAVLDSPDRLIRCRSPQGSNERNTLGTFINTEGLVNGSNEEFDDEEDHLAKRIGALCEGDCIG